MTGEKTIEQMMDDFLSSLNAEYTRKTYATPLNHFVTYLQGKGVHADRDSVSTLTVDHAIEFVPWLRYEYFPDPDQPAKATLQLYLTAIYRFYRSLLKRGITLAASDIARLEETYRDARSIRGEPRPKDPKLAAVRAVIQAAHEEPPEKGKGTAHQQRELARLRDIAIVETLRSTGCRVGELVTLRRADLDWLARSALVKGKGSKYRKVYLDNQAWSALKAYLQARQDGGDGRALARLPVFAGHGNRSGKTLSPLTTRHVARIVQSLAEKADISEVGVSPHYFRHVFATRALDQTENLALVQDMLGHASPATTRVYARTDEEQRREGYARVWEEGGRMEHSVEQAAVTDVEPVEAESDLEVLLWREVRARKERAPQLGEYEIYLQAALTAVLLSGACSLSELTQVLRHDLDREGRRLSVRSYERVPMNEHDRLLLLKGEAWAALMDYVEVRDSYPAPGLLGPNLLFCDLDGSSLDPEDAYERVAALAARVGVRREHLYELL
jgi:site-specific recombinase XerD